MSDHEDRFPGLTEACAERIQKDLQKRFPGVVDPIPWERWKTLKGSLATYRKDAEFLRGFLNKGQIAQINMVAKQATRLRTTLLATEEAGLSIALEAAIEPLSIQGFHDLLAQLELRLGIEHQKDFLPDGSRSDLFWRFERWWKTTTGLKAGIEEGSTEVPHPTPFMYVANEIFSLPGMPAPTGASYATLKGFRRDVRGERRKIEKFGAALRSIQGFQQHEEDPEDR